MKELVLSTLTELLAQNRKGTSFQTLQTAMKETYDISFPADHFSEKLTVVIRRFFPEIDMKQTEKTGFYLLKLKACFEMLVASDNIVNVPQRYSSRI